jgi:hypothetical protein
MSFEIEKSRLTGLNKAKAKIFNLSSDTAGKMGKHNYKLTIKAGYDDENNLTSIFFGNITKSTSGKDNTNKFLEIEAFDGYKNINAKTITLSYAANTPMSTVLNDITSALTYPIGGKRPTLTGNYAGGFAFQGPAAHALTQVLKRAGYNWSIQNEQIIIYEIGKEVNSVSIVLNADSGLMKVESVDQSATKSVSKKGGKAIVGASYKLHSLLFPQLVPGAKVKVKHSDLDGWVVVESVKITGDNFGGDFKVEADVRGA